MPAAYPMATATPVFSAVQLQRQLGMSRYETAWMMLHKLRRAMVNPERQPSPGRSKSTNASWAAWTGNCAVAGNLARKRWWLWRSRSAAPGQAAFA